MNFKSTLFAIIIVGLIVTAAGVIISEWNSEYSSGISSDLDYLNKISEASDTAEEQKGKINPQSGEASSDFETETFRGAYGIITSIFTPLRIIFGSEGMIDSVVTKFGIPTYIWQSIVAMILFAITFTLISIIFRRGREST